MNKTDLLKAFDREVRRDRIIPDMRRDVLTWGVRHVRLAPGQSYLEYFELDETNADAAIQEQVEYFQALQQGLAWSVHDHDRPADLKQRLLVHGFTPDEPASLMIFDLQRKLVGSSKVIEGGIRRIDQRVQLRDVIQVLEKVYERSFDWVWERMGSQLAIPGYLSIYVAFVAGSPASAGWIYYYPGCRFAALFGGSTIHEQRGKGLYTAILACRAEEARQRGHSYLFVEAGPMSEPLLARAGFIRLGAVQDFELSFPAPDGG